MTDAADLVMPKLGLTMTEGRIARWAVAAGERFAKGDCIVEIETDKIVNEVEAPTDGTMLAHLVPAGETVAVGTPIARWLVEGSATAPAPPSSSRPAEAAPPPVVKGAPTESRGQRIVATPYARKRAREAGLVIDDIAGSGPGGRIKAADVERALQTVASMVQTRAAATREDAAAWSPRPDAAFSLIVVDFDASRLVEIARGSARAGRQVTTDRLAAIAAVRALEAVEPHRASFVIGLGDPARLTTFTADAGGSGSHLLSRISSDGAAGDVAIVEARDGERLWAPEVPHGWRAVLVVGASRPTALPAADGGVIWREIATLTLGYAAAGLPHAAARRFVADVRDALEDPLYLLAS